MTSDLSAHLAGVNALLTAGALACMAVAYRAIRRKQIARHRNFMLAAVGLSAAFMVLFVIRFVVFGFRPFGGSGAWKGVYYGLLLLHEPIAVLSVPLVLVAAGLGLRRARVHAEFARPALLVWAISCASGVLIYLLLYRLPVG